MTAFARQQPADPVFRAQANFRALMDALSRPGTIQRLSVDDGAMGLDADLAAVALTLVDHETSVWLSPSLSDDRKAREWLAFATGAPQVDAPELAAFALIAEADPLPDFKFFGQGTQEYPDRSTTIVKACGGLTHGPRLTCSGPGIKSTLTITPAGLGTDFVERWSENRAQYPRGVDLILCAGGAVMGMPRTLTIERLEV
ncbi:phosphonate C-P lyase system protein PhnH [Rhizobium sp. EC-SD404]|uniref:phosphonate C-P lyase system protein PhnH n=1 Tax=Rhizobium sp. EC-SD404 TaxID=2038389 RepID=UPI00125344D3|nr:phosphonate C-P lyase system protein PhnH [Rhizobium sp. EC-SD404]VVT09258.1 Alpha-D-ribose 1-methylphosphonate 5-triphosphate synthase subunit PhnH [Rhizobium sp. EC-SD404]